MFPPKVAGFQCNQKGALTSLEVKICVAHARGPKPRAYLPLGYDNSSPLERNYAATGIRVGCSEGEGLQP